MKTGSGAIWACKTILRKHTPELTLFETTHKWFVFPNTIRTAQAQLRRTLLSTSFLLWYQKPRYDDGWHTSLLSWRWNWRIIDCSPGVPLSDKHSPYDFNWQECCLHLVEFDTNFPKPAPHSKKKFIVIVDPRVKPFVNILVGHQWICVKAVSIR